MEVMVVSDSYISITSSITGTDSPLLFLIHRLRVLHIIGDDGIANQNYFLHFYGI